jgi:anti-sigma regulatory factor (Ser/Thr protein kinase)
MTSSQEWFPSTAASLSGIRRVVAERAREGSFTGDSGEIALAVSEACANVVLHTSSERIRVTFTIDPGSLQIEVADSGVFGEDDPYGRQGGGYGFTLMRALMDEVSIQEGTRSKPGTVVRLVKRKEGTP